MMMTMRGRKTVLAGVALAACMVLLFAATHTTAQLVTPTMEVGELCLVTEVPEVPEDTTGMRNGVTSKRGGGAGR